MKRTSTGIIAGLVGLLVLGARVADDYLVFGRTPPLVVATTSPIAYYLSLPRGWNRLRKWPVLVAIDGSNKEFARNSRLFQRARGDRPYIIATPMVVSNGPRYEPSKYRYHDSVWKRIRRDGYEAFDEDGLLAIHRDLQQRYGGESQFYMTGWSAGGRITWCMVLKHPELLAGVVLSDANYGQGPDSFSADAHRALLPIMGLQGTADAGFSSMDAQWRKAMPIARAHGYRNIQRTIIEGGTHSPFPAEVFHYIDSLRSGPSSHE